jgi:CRP-like cAMP-binding protein
LRHFARRLHVVVVHSSPVVDPLDTFAVDDGGVHPSPHAKEFGMTPDGPIDAGSPSPLFAGLSRRQLALASRLSTQLEIPAGRVLAREGSVGTEFIVVLDGQVDVLCQDDLVATRGPGTPLGEIALLSGRPRTATLVARTPLRVQVSSRSEFECLLADIPELSRRLHATMAERLAA